jgi:hypothetical protein
MKSYLYKCALITSFIAVLSLVNTSIAQETDASDYRMLFKFHTVKQSDNSRLLEVSFIGMNKKNKRDKLPVYDAEIKFFNRLDEQEVLLGASKTSKEGIAQLSFKEDHSFITDTDGTINFIARFEGTDGIDEQEEELRVKDLHLELNLKEVDSTRVVQVYAFTKDSLGNKNPVSETDVVISVGSMLAKMKLEESTIEGGTFEFEFPEGIPGDVDGNVSIYSIIEDHDDFGNVTKKETINWGILNKQPKEHANMLWTHAAPLWMYIVLTIMLVGVWVNYVYTIFHLIKLKKEGDIINLETR